MVAETPGGGGAVYLIDRNLQDAYDNMRWYRQLIGGMANRGTGNDSADDSVMSLLKPLDWDKSAVEDTIEILAKGARDVDSISQELASLKSNVTEAWQDQLIEGKVQAVIGTLAKDYDAFHDELKNMQKHGKHDVCDGIDDATGGVLSITEDLKTQYGWLAELAHSDPLLYDDDSDGARAVKHAKKSLERAVKDAEGKVAELKDHLKSDKDPVHMSSGSPPKGYDH